MHPLLAVQDLDTKTAQLSHRRATLPERDAIAVAEKEVATLDERIAEVEVERHELSRHQKRYEDEAATVEARAGGEKAKLYSGSVTAVKELQALEEEIGSLGRRQSELEDHVLELMEAGEPIDALLAELAGSRSVLIARLDDLVSSLTAAEAEIDSELSEVASKRSEAAASVDAADLADYEALTPEFGARTVVGFSGTDCTGCPLSMPAMEADRVKHEPEGSLVHCDECGRIVAR